MNRQQFASARGQALVELALVLPLFLMVLVGIISLGLGVFYQQQLTHAAREAARYAAIHSATAIDPVTSNLPVNPTIVMDTNNFVAPDRPNNRWPSMAAAARDAAFGLDRNSIGVTACWSGYWQVDSTGTMMPNSWDASPENGTGQTNVFRDCTIPVPNATTGVVENVDPKTGTNPSTGASVTLGCSVPLPVTTSANDLASNLAWSQYPAANEVTVYACYVWHPPLAGFLLIPDEVIIRAVVTEALQHQR